MSYEIKPFFKILVHCLLNDSLRQRAQSERLQILGERLRRVRGHRVRCSLIPIILIPYPTTVHIPISTLPTDDHPQQHLSSERTIRNTSISIASSSTIHFMRNTMPSMPLQPYHSWKHCKSYTSLHLPYFFLPHLAGLQPLPTRRIIWL